MSAMRARRHRRCRRLPVATGCRGIAITEAQELIPAERPFFLFHAPIGENERGSEIGVCD
jgi:hypothetical protein